MYRIVNSFLVTFLVVTFFSTTSLVPCARAAVIGTSSYIEKSAAVSVDDLNGMVQREDVQERLVALGVNPEDASRRIAAMNANERRLVQQKIDEMAAGGDVLAILGVVLLVLIVLEILGVTNVFTRL